MAPRQSLAARLWRGGLGLFLGLMLALAAAMGAVLATETGARWLLAQVPGLEVQDWQGRLIGPELGAGRLRLTLADGAQLHIEQLRLQGVGWRWRPHPGAWLGVDVASLVAQSLRWQSAPTPTDADVHPTLPDQLGVPVHLRLAQVQLAQVQVDAQPALHDLQARVELGAAQGQQHRVEGLRLHTDRFSLAGALQLHTTAPLALQAGIDLAALPNASTAWQARVDVTGTLSALELSAWLRGAAAAQGGTGQATALRAGPQLDAQAVVYPFAVWPLGPTRLSTRALDLRSLLATAPHTRLDAELTLDKSGHGQPAELSLALDNAAAGAWDAGQLPLRRLRARLSTPVSTLDSLPSQIVLDRLAIDWGAGHHTGGQLSGQGEFRQQGAGHQLWLNLDTQQWRPAVLDRRLPAMVLSGPLRLVLAQARPDVSGQGALSLQLKGQMDTPGAPGAPVSLSLDSRLDARRLSLHQLQAQAAGASLEVSGWLERRAKHWQWNAQAQMRDFDPTVWFPGQADGAWQQGPHRLNLALHSDAQLERGATVAHNPPLWRHAQGSVQLTLEPSVLAGVPVQGQLTVAHDATGLVGHSQWRAAGNLLQLQTAWPLDGIDDWQVQLDAPQLARLHALVALLPELAPHWPQGGGVSLNARGRGQAAQLRWQLHAELTDLAAGPLRIGRGDVDAELGPDIQTPFTLQTQVSDAQWRRWPITQAHAQAQGTLHAHQLRLELDSPAHPPAWFEQWQNNLPGSGSRLALALEGRWQPDDDNNPAAESSWNALIQQLQLGPRNDSGSPWVAGQNLALELHLDAAQRPDAARLAPGRLRLPGTQLHWQQAQWAARPEAELPAITLDARLDPLAVAPLLAYLQPDMGWRGDLALDGVLRLQTDTQVDLELVLQRQRGDLSLSETQADMVLRQTPLQLSDLRLALTAHEGQWSFTQAMAGQTLGRASGVISARTLPEQLLPAADTPLSGSLDVEVAHLAAWGAWVPVGWRLGGSLSSQAHVTGTLGKPQLTGRIDGRDLAVRNGLQGVAWTDGTLAVVLDGDRMQIETFELKAGDGRLRANGAITLGPQVQMVIDLQAQRFLALSRLDRRVTLSGDSRFSQSVTGSKLTGQLKLDEGWIDIGRSGAPTLDDDVTVVTDRQQVQPVASNGHKPAPLLLDLSIDLGEKLRIKGRGLESLLTGQLHLDNPGGKLAVNGTVRTDDGNYAAYGQKLDIRRGLIVFTGAVENPRLDIYAVRPDLDINVGVLVSGTALNPRVRLVSDAEMTDMDRLSWLLLGRASEGLGQADTALLQRAALALLAGDEDGPASNLIKGVGLTDFSLRQSTDANDVRTTVVSVGKQLSRRWYVGYERGVNATAGTWQLIYRIAQRFTLRLQSGEDSALDLIWSWRFD